ncbi:hypothetical protein ACW9KT_15655 [Hymenobacter sp. HD11105]
MAISLPKKYQWLVAEPAPRLLLEVLKLVGTKEIVGGQNSPAIMSWLKELRFDWIKNDETPWCGTALAIAAVRAGVAERHPEMPRAFWWLTWGVPVVVPMLGDVLVFDFSHVGIYVGEDATHYHTAGGNQNNRHGIDRFPKASLKGARRTPWKIAQPATVRRILLSPEGVLSEVATR